MTTGICMIVVSSLLNNPYKLRHWTKFRYFLVMTTGICMIVVSSLLNNPYKLRHWTKFRYFLVMKKAYGNK